jgi:hypothetical protein
VRSPVSLSSSSAGRSSPVSPSRLPILEPTTFLVAAEDVAGWTVVRRRLRSSDSSDVSCSDPNNQRISKNELLGSLPKFNNNLARSPGRPSMHNAAHREARRAKAQSAQTIPQKFLFTLTTLLGVLGVEN